MSLGKGLESLIPQKSARLEEAKQNFPFKSGIKSDNIFYIEIEKIKPNPYQPRRDFDAQELNSLSDSMKEYGMLQPLLVSKIEKQVPSGTMVEYQLIAGERRLKAAGLAGLRQVPVIIKAPDESTKLELALIENVQRQNLNSLEEARAYKKLIDEFNLTQAQVAQKMGKSREAVANKIRLLDLPLEVQANVESGKISEGHAKVLLMVKNPERQRYLAEEIFKKELSVRTLEDLVKAETSYKVQFRPSRMIDPALEEYKKIIQDALGASVAISGNKQKGRLAINFYSEEDLNRLIKKLSS